MAPMPHSSECSFLLRHHQHTLYLNRASFHLLSQFKKIICYRFKAGGFRTCMVFAWQTLRHGCQINIQTTGFKSSAYDEYWRISVQMITYGKFRNQPVSETDTNNPTLVQIQHKYTSGVINIKEEVTFFTRQTKNYATLLTIITTKIMYFFFI